MTRDLTTKEQAFVEAYLTHWNATEAARLAGYKNPNKLGPRKLVEVGIQARIAERMAELKMSADEVLARLTEHARGSIADFIDLVEPASPDQAADLAEAKAIAGGWRLNLAKAQQAGVLHLVKKLKSGQWGPEIELYDAQAALALLGKHHRLFVDRTEHSGAIGVVKGYTVRDVSPDAWETTEDE